MSIIIVIFINKGMSHTHIIFITNGGLVSKLPKKVEFSFRFLDHTKIYFVAELAVYRKN